ncbi:diguanylate cyclase domain-containing protein, partial [Caenispirillum salinarum]|uniref:diguanylate cyclase domain-containing protein n=1 Tax=Caenispirillum salinarum TaxID=859058 RepID=UPI0005BD27BB
MPLDVLLIEDNPTDARLFEDLVNDSGDSVAIKWARSIAEARDSAGQVFDVVVTDLGLPDSRGLETAERVLAEYPGCPVVVMTGLDDPQAGVQAVQAGCQDYVVKGITDPALLVRTLRHAVERRAAERRIRESEERFRTLIEMSPDAIVLIAMSDVPEDAEIMFANSVARRLFKVGAGSDLAGAAASRVFNGIDASGLVHALCHVSREGDGPRGLGDFRLSDGTGARIAVEVSAAPVFVDGRRAVQAVVRDISARREREREQRLAQAVFRTTAEAMMITDAERRIITVNPAFTQITGYPVEDVRGRSPSLLASGRHDAAFYADMWETLEAEGHWRGDVWNRRSDGEVYVQRLTISRITDADGVVTNYVGVFSDVTEEKEASAALQYSASHDALTGLPNRALMVDRLEQALGVHARTGGGLSVLFIDLDGFKPVNDTHGHLAGDLLLQGVAERLRGCVRDSDTVARQGGDEFVVLSHDATDPESAATIADKILQALRPSFDVGAASVRVGASIGIAQAPRDGTTVEDILHAADGAMYEAKRAGKGVWRFAGNDEEPVLLAY